MDTMNFYGIYITPSGVTSASWTFYYSFMGRLTGMDEYWTSKYMLVVF